MDPTPRPQLERLEAHIAHLEKHYDELNEVVIEQGRELARLRLHIQRLTTSFDGLELDRIKATNSKPPHSAL